MSLLSATSAKFLVDLTTNDDFFFYIKVESGVTCIKTIVIQQLYDPERNENLDCPVRALTQPQSPSYSQTDLMPKVYAGSVRIPTYGIEAEQALDETRLESSVVLYEGTPTGSTIESVGTLVYTLVDNKSHRRGTS